MDKPFKSYKTKGFIFTLTTLLLLSAIFMITAAYLQRNLQAQEFIARTAYGNRISFIRENIVSDYYTMLDIELDQLTREDGVLILEFDEFSNISIDAPYQQRLSEYETFIETDYDKLINAKISIENFVPEFTLAPYNATFVIDKNRFYFYSNDIQKLKNISITIQVNVSGGTVQTVHTTGNSNDVRVRITVLDNQSVVLYNQTLWLSRTKERSRTDRLFITFNQTTYFPNLTVEFGKHRQLRYYGPDILTNGTLFVEANRLNAKITGLKMAFDDTPKKAVMRTKAYMAVD